MRILLTDRGSRLRALICQLAADLVARGHQVATLSGTASVALGLESQGVRVYSPGLIASCGAGRLDGELAALRGRPGEAVSWKGLALWEMAENEIFRARIEGRSLDRDALLRRALGAAAAAEAVLADFRPQLVAVWNGCILEARVMEALARRSGAAVCYLERGLLPDSLVIDPHGVNAHSRFGRPAGPGAPAPVFTEAELAAARTYLERSAEHGRSVVRQPERIAAAEVRARLDLPAGTRLVLLPAQIDWDTNILYHCPRFPTNLSVIAALRGALTAEGAVLVFKPHPEEPRPTDWRAALGELGRLAEGLNLHSLIAAADAVVVRNSTAGLEAVIHRKPVLVLGRALWSHRGFTHDLAAGEAAGDGLHRALRDGFTAGMGAAADRFFAGLTRDYLYFLDDAGPFPGSNRGVLQRLLATAEPDRTAVPGGGLLSGVLPEAEGIMRHSCALLREATRALESLRREPARELLVVRACDVDVFGPEVAAAVGAGLAGRVTALSLGGGALAGFPQDRARLLTGLAGALRAALPAVLGRGPRAVIVVCNSLARPSTQARFFLRLLRRHHPIAVEAGFLQEVLAGQGRRR